MKRDRVPAPFAGAAGHCPGTIDRDTLIMGIRDAGKVKSILGIPAGETLMSVIAVGKAAAKPIKVPRKPVAEVLKTT